MVCSNCHSDDVITVQDQLICVNCGRLVTAAEAAAQKKDAKGKPKVKIAAKRGPGRPRAVKLDTPRQRATTHRIDDIRPVVPKAAVKPKQSAPVETSKPPQQHRVVHHSVVVAAFEALNLKWIGLAVPGAMLVSSAATLTVWAYLATSRAEQGRYCVVAVLLGLSGIIWLRYIRVAAMFWRAGVHDHRLSASKTAMRVSLTHTGKLWLFNVRHGAAALAELSLLVAVVWYGGRITQLPILAHLALVFIACFGLLYLLSSLWVVQRLVEAGIVISSLSLPVAHKLGWRLWRKHWELLGARLAALIAVMTLAGVIGVGLTLALRHLPLAVQLIIVVLVASLLIAALTVMSGGAAEASFRQTLSMTMPQRASGLLGRRKVLKVTKGALWLFIVSLASPLAAAVGVIALWH
jgi:hypothetical protein